MVASDNTNTQFLATISTSNPDYTERNACKRVLPEITECGTAKGETESWCAEHFNGRGTELVLLNSLWCLQPRFPAREVSSSSQKNPQRWKALCLWFSKLWKSLCSEWPVKDSPASPYRRKAICLHRRRLYNEVHSRQSPLQPSSIRWLKADFHRNTTERNPKERKFRAKRVQGCRVEMASELRDGERWTKSYKAGRKSTQAKIRERDCATTNRGAKEIKNRGKKEDGRRKRAMVRSYGSRWTRRFSAEL